MPASLPFPFKHDIDRRQILQSSLALPLLALPAGCTSGEKLIPPTGEEKVLSLYCWDTYIDQAILDQFTRLSGIKVAMNIMSSNAALWEAIKGGNGAGYDVVLPSNNYIERMIKAELLLPLETARLPNRVNIDTPFVDVGYDPGRQFSMPFTWFALGIAYDKRKLKKPPKSWKPLLDSDAFKGRIALLSEGADVFRIYAKYLGKSLNQMTVEDVHTIEAMLERQKPNLHSFHEDNGQDLLDSGALDMVMEYNGDIAQLMQKNPNIGFVVPKEGTILNGDNLAIPVGAKHPKNAHTLINFLMSAEIGKQIAQSRLYPTCNGAAKALMGPDYLENPVLYLPAEPLARSEFAILNEKLDAEIDTAFARVKGA